MSDASARNDLHLMLFFLFLSSVFFFLLSTRILLVCWMKLLCLLRFLKFYLSLTAVLLVLVVCGLSYCRPVLMLCHCLCNLFVQSLEEGVLSRLWKASITAPLFKNDSRCNPLNCHSVSLPSVCWKVVDRGIVSQFVGYPELNGL